MRFRTNKLRNLVITYWQPAVFYGMLVFFFAMLSWFRLGSLVAGAGSGETAALAASASFQGILDNPLNAPFLLLAHLIGLFHDGQEILPLRIAAVVFGLLALSAFYWLVRHWHGERSAILGTVLLGCSPWFLHTIRAGEPGVLLLLPLILAAAGVWLRQTKNTVVMIAGFVLAAATLYVPGLIWFVIFGAAWHFKTLYRLAKQHFLAASAAAVGLLALIAPLVWAAYKSPETLKQLAGLPADGWPQITETGRRLAEIPYNLFARGPENPEIWLGRLPVLDAFAIVMLLLGFYLYIRHRKLIRSKTVLGSLAIGTALISLGGAVGLTILVPFLYILVAAGLSFMVDRWQAVFPRNPIAQIFGVAMISAAVIAASWYGLRHYFVAWPNAPETKQSYTLEQS